MDLPVLAQVALLLMAASVAAPTFAIVVLALRIPFMDADRRREAHRSLDKLIRFVLRGRFATREGPVPNAYL